MSRENVGVVRRGVEAWNQHDADLWLSYAAPEIEWMPAGPAALERTVYRGYEEVATGFAAGVGDLGGVSLPGMTAIEFTERLPSGLADRLLREPHGFEGLALVRPEFLPHAESIADFRHSAKGSRYGRTAPSAFEIEAPENQDLG